MYLKHVKSCGDIDISEWNFFVFDDTDIEGNTYLEYVASKNISRIIKKEFSKILPEAHLVWIHKDDAFSITKNSKKPKDPLTVYFGIPLTNDEFLPVFYECSLTKLFKNLTQEWETDGCVGDKYVTETSLLMANELRKIANHLEKFSIRSSKKEKQND